jgi:Zn-finger protein
MSRRDLCFNCGRGEAEVPIISWRYQGGNVWVCSQCLPLLIHKLEQVVDVLRETRETEERDGDNV